uniref:Immunoglobulin V-set domain-containing protein n=1 Tax=Neolamprologus brichardi TaxID=32507 RepID=A0A3Q4GF30_NEOBR
YCRICIGCCQIFTDEIISVLKWSRADLNTDGYVYFYRNKRFYENYQHPSFHGRVKLRDPEMKDGDVSVILKNVTFNDTGIYECHIAVRNPVRSKRAHTEISHFINLTVTGEFVELTLSSHIIYKTENKISWLPAPTGTVQSHSFMRRLHFSALAT